MIKVLLATLLAAALALAAEPPQPAPDPKPAPEAKPEPAPQPEERPGEKTPEPIKPDAVKPEPAKVDAYMLAFKVKDIDGQEKSLEDFKGKVVVIVNVASKCGLTPQYKGLEALYQSKKDAGLVILGFPANNFAGQEPSSESEIKEFCSTKYSVTFPMFSKVSVKGPDAHALYKKLAAQPAPIGGEPDWNFTKYIVDRKGNAVAHFQARTKPDDAEFLKTIENLLAQK